VLGNLFYGQFMKVAQRKHAVAHRWQVLHGFAENVSEFLLSKEF